MTRVAQGNRAGRWRAPAGSAPESALSLAVDAPSLAASRSEAIDFGPLLHPAHRIRLRAWCALHPRRRS